MKKITWALLFLLFISSFRAQKLAQQYFLENAIQDSIEHFYLDSFDYKFHNSIKPYITGFTQNYANKNSRLNRFYHQFTEMDIEFPHNRYQFTVLPTIDIQAGRDLLNNSPIYRLSGGILTRIDINKDFSLQLQYQGGITQTSNFIAQFIDDYRVLPGEGKARAINAKAYAFDQLQGFISYSPKPLINLQIGKGKHFIGNGYRSLLLSDVANNYPYFKLSANPWHFQYQFLATWLKDLYSDQGLKNKNTNKFGVFHYFDWNATKWLNVGLFENVVWQGTDSNRTRGFDPNYLNPVIFFRPVEYSLGSSDNSMLGFNTSIKIKKRVELYGQVALDEFLLKNIVDQNGWWANKYGIQAGFKFWLLSQRNSTLKFQMEYNYVRPFTYTHGSVQQNYAHYNQPLAHPFGANFKELYSCLNYQFKNIQLSLSNVYAQVGVSEKNENIGQNIFQSYNSRLKEFGHETVQGRKKVLVNTELRCAYVLVPALNIKAEIALQQYTIQDKVVGDWHTPAIYFSLYSGVLNRYRDLFVK